MPESPKYQPFPNYPSPQPGYPPPVGGIPHVMPVLVPFREQLTSRQKTGQFFAGLGTGVIPVVLVLLALSSVILHDPMVETVAGIAFYLAIGLFIAAFVLAIVFMAQPARRFLGFGMFTIVLASPVIFIIGWFVIFTVACSISYC